MKFQTTTSPRPTSDPGPRRAIAQLVPGPALATRPPQARSSFQTGGLVPVPATQPSGGPAPAGPLLVLRPLRHQGGLPRGPGPGMAPVSTPGLWAETWDLVPSAPAHTAMGTTTEPGQLGLQDVDEGIIYF